MARIPNTPRYPFRPLRALIEREANDTLSLIARIPDFLSREECERVVAAAQRVPPHLGTVGEGGIDDPIRRSEVRFFYPAADTAWLFDKLERAIDALNATYRFDLMGFYEGFQVASYTGGGHYDWHIDLGTGNYSTRKLSLSVQLTDERDYDGGELEFQASSEPVPRTQGTLIAFPSFLVHRVKPVTRGARWSMVSWIAGPPFR